MPLNEQILIKISYLLSGTVAFPVIFGLYRYRQLDFSFRIFVCIYLVALIHEFFYDFIIQVDNKHLYEKIFATIDISLTYVVLLIWGGNKQTFKKAVFLTLALAISFIIEDVIQEKGQYSYSLVDPFFICLSQ